MPCFAWAVIQFSSLIEFIIYSSKSSQLLNLVVQEIQPKIRVIQKAVFETETAKQAIFNNVKIIEKRLMPNVPSDSEAVTRQRK